MSTYNGWTNKQTWNINLTYGDTFHVMAKEQDFDDVEHLADAFESIVGELETTHVMEGTLASQVLGEYLNKVNWTEIAEHVAGYLELFEEQTAEIE